MLGVWWLVVGLALWVRGVLGVVSVVIACGVCCVGWLVCLLCWLVGMSVVCVVFGE